jgi:Ribbon-helix-helix protein, copG family.
VIRGPIIKDMAIPTIKSTYSLDLETVQALEELARRWGVSKSEALRRAIRAAAGEERRNESDALKALDELQQSLILSPGKGRAWASHVRAERKAASARRETRRA